MTEQEAQALINAGGGIDAGEAAHAEAAATGMLDGRGQIVAEDPNAKAMEWFLVPKTVAWAITTIYPEVAEHYTDAKCLELAAAIVPVAEKYGLNGMGASPELMLVIGCIGFGAPAFIAHKARKKAEEEAAAKKEAEGGNGGR
ncbi:hypothetical protein [Duganella sp. BJB476]|uniref:hypothetical protein n=1 Tax=Duganella sp. BJB476 TaxID=1871176 RepID=UPI000E34F95B|nr:hypothetical protein [Duganella sp. BJB476]RFP36151.1 hypothetical protein D0T21_06870 [Duganella sp. BJB476]